MHCLAKFAGENNLPKQLPQIDSHIRVVTPENIAFEYRVASPFERAFAYFIDAIIMIIFVTVIVFVSFMILGSMGFFELAIGVGLISLFVVTWFYGAVFETFWNGQTPGKRSMGLRVVRTDGSPINAGQAVLRNFLRLVDGLPGLFIGLTIPTYLVGLLATSMNSRYQRLGDLACGTMVVAEDRSKAKRFNEINDVMLGPVEDMLPPGALPSRTLAKAIAQYVERRQYFGPERRAEIAGHIGKIFVDEYNLPTGIDYDALLCVLYRRAFLSTNTDEDLDNVALPPDSSSRALPPPASQRNPYIEPLVRREFEPPR